MLQRISSTIKLSIGFLCFASAVPAVYPSTKPIVASTSPANEATDISSNLASYSITFSKPMDTKYGLVLTDGFPETTVTWSLDKTTLTAARTNLSTPLPEGRTYKIHLNFPGIPQDYMYRDTDGNLLDHYVLSFTIEGGYAGLHKIPANPAKGFSWPYYLYVPQTLKNPAVFFVQPNNTGTSNDDPAVHDNSAKSLIQSTAFWADNLGSPYLIPVFPRPATLAVGYTHALDRPALLATVPGYERLDLQLIAMINDARSILNSNKIEVDEKIFMAGVSASGSFVSRFSMLHPDMIKAASIGAPGYGPIVPVSSWNGQNLPYPEGIADLKDLVGTGFDTARFQAVPLQVYVGDEDDNIASYWNTSDPTVARVMAAFGGKLLYSRWPRYEAAYSSVTSLSQFVVFPGMGHAWAPWSYMQEFFENNRFSPHPPLEKPLKYKIYFPHVASVLSWETEVALVNTIPGGVSVKGKLQAFRADGGDPIESLAIEIPPGGRKEITVGNLFQRHSDIAYMAFLSDSGFLAGYTRFNQPGNRVSLPAASGVTQGWFPKMEKDGYTGLAFVNVNEIQTTLKLAAYDDNGAKIAEESFSVPAGNKVVGLVDLVFHEDVSRARYFYFSSDQKVVAFSVSGSDDGQMLDGLPSLDWYIR